MSFVLDASIAASWALEPEGPPLADIAEHQLDRAGAVVPAIWSLEIRNALLMAERRGRISEADVFGAVNSLAHMHIEIDRFQDADEVLAVARRFRLTTYDAAYLELAQRRSIPLASLDRALVAAARDAGVKLLDEV